jgi:hypothetical protein
MLFDDFKNIFVATENTFHFIIIYKRQKTSYNPCFSIFSLTNEVASHSATCRPEEDLTEILWLLGNVSLVVVPSAYAWL